MNAIPGKRGLRWLLLASASLSAIALFLLATATANTALFAQGYDNLLILERESDLGQGTLRPRLHGARGVEEQQGEGTAGRGGAIATVGHTEG